MLTSERIAAPNFKQEAEGEARGNFGFTFDQWPLFLRFTLLAAALTLPVTPAIAEKAYEAITENSTAGTTSHIWSDGKGKMRSESIIAGVNQVTISDYNNKVSYSINDQARTITKIPFSAPDAPSAKTQWQAINGVKVIEGHPCTGKRANVDGSVMEVWTGTDTDCSVLVTSNGKSVMKLKNWWGKAPNPSLFCLPSGYKMMDMTEMMKNIQSGNFNSAAMQKLYKQ